LSLTSRNRIHQAHSGRYENISIFSLWRRSDARLQRSQRIRRRRIGPFQADPEWKKVKAESEAQGPLVDHIDRYFMDPTSYSALN
jgi:hypothetical protein